ncbi:MAG: MBL fold metallo-hydrolase [Chloroflexota bacterium]
MHVTQLTPNLYWYRDVCNVYLLSDGHAGILIDFGSGEILDHLEEIGVREIEAVYHTHHHRDQCQGDDKLADRGIPIGVPEREAAQFAETEAFWRLKRIYHNYDVSSVGNSLPRPVPVAHRLRDYERIEWRGHAITVLPTPGHTKGSVTYLFEVDGKRVGACGDLIAEPGALHTIHDLQWQYGMPDALGAALHSTMLVRAQGLDLLLPSHGHPMTTPNVALDQLAVGLRRLYELQREMRANRAFHVWPHSVDQPKAHVLPHLWANPHSVSNVYALTADDGRALLLDYGFPSWDHFSCDLRFVEHSLDELRAVAGLTKVEAVIPSHYHDDHLAGLPYLQQEHGVQAWIFENFVDIVENPRGYNIPCLIPHPIRVDRSLRDGGSFEWEGYNFDVFHMPGHTWWALGMFGVVDGIRIAFTGDNLLAGTISPLRAAAPIYRNRMLVDSIAVGVERLMDYKPELLLSGHTGAIPITRKMLEDFHTWARDMSDAWVKLVSVPDEVNFALDPGFATLYPYRSSPSAGVAQPIELRVFNHSPRDESLRAELALPAAWSCSPRAVELNAPAGTETRVSFRVSPPADARGRHVICADVTLGARRFGQVCEAIVDVEP